MNISKPPSVQIQIRRGGEKDLSALYGLIDTLGFHKEPGYFEKCFEENRDVFIATLDGTDAGYTTLNRTTGYVPFRKQNIPVIQDLNVVPACRRQGVARALIQHCENTIRDEGHTQIGIGFGLYKDYGPAQRLYVSMGYIPDGLGVTYDNEPVTPGTLKPVDDNLCLWLVRDLQNNCP